MINITDSAQAKIQDILAEENKPNTRLRMFVQGGGCSGFNYGFTLDEDKTDDDWEVPAGLTVLLVDSMSMMYLDGSTVDYEETLMGSSFKIQNPQAASTCGCGSSFSI